MRGIKLPQPIPGALNCCGVFPSGLVSKNCPLMGAQDISESQCCQGLGVFNSTHNAKLPSQLL